MKSKLGLFLITALFAGSMTVSAQGGGMRRTVEERVKTVHEKVDSAFKLDADKLAKVDATFTTYYKAQDKVREDMRAAAGGERPDMQAMREKMQPLVEARDKDLKGILTEAQFKTFKDEIEPAMMPRRGGGRPQQ